MTIFFFVCRCLLLTCASCRAEGVYMGYHIGVAQFANKRFPGNTFMFGWCFTLSRDVAEALVSYKPLRRLAYLPYSEERDHEFALLQFHSDDAMVGWVLEKELNYKPMVYVKMLPCHYHDARDDTGHWQVVPTFDVCPSCAGDDYAAAHGALRQRHIACRPCGTGLRRRDIPLLRLTNERNECFSVRVES
ncbi:putative UDP-Gal or UDP-GlcNAc-dependent glycosyltransferase [Trypanosoma cruzi]|uniref:Putative UDP-Gal or UDP-GlcNAc-dependent glycosyltransferase n=1 Tax=Trypanosoma cruzi TaxID=5693 RepID=A0A2V2W506_TRYCR|nr:putative UDP-Gal or UDP-GlcNAc-dependent glycosyltransferase [Trypanosoma cruzi]